MSAKLKPGDDGEDPADAAGDTSGMTGMALAGASRATADAYLAEQTKLARLQVAGLEREDALRHWSLIVHHFGEVMKVTFEAGLALLLIAVAIAAGAAIWSAANDRSVVISSFSTPPDFASRGMNGDVVASQMLDKLAAMQRETDSARPESSYSSNWGSDLKVQIPNTGVSLSEIDRLLRRWLGHQTYVSGEIYRTQAGITVTARTSGGEGATFTGPESDLDALEQKAAEQIYARTQPYRYAIYVASHDRRDEAFAVWNQLTQSPDPLERAWAWIGLGNGAQNALGNERLALTDFQKAAATMPELTLDYENIEASQTDLGHDEEALEAARTTVRLLSRDPLTDISPRAANVMRPGEASSLAAMTGDYASAIATAKQGIALPDYSGSVENMREIIATALALSHDEKAAWAWFRAMPPAAPQGEATRLTERFKMEIARENWKSAEDAGLQAEAAWKEYSPGWDLKTVFATSLHPLLALARAHDGDMAGALALIATTPSDCYLCLRVHGAIAALQGNTQQATRWYSQAVARAPSIPFAYVEWGRMLLQTHDVEGAIAKFTLANQKGPHFADPLELWGEALIAKSRSDLACVKFENANRYAPHWGRLHLKWGEALLWSGDKNAAEAQFAQAAKLDLTPTERSELKHAMAKV